MNDPITVIENNIQAGIKKASLPLGKMILLGIFAGAFIALGACTSSTAVHNIDNVGIARFLAGCIFPVGLILVVFTGGELFTGNNLMILAVMDRKIRLSRMLRNLTVVYFANLAGSLFVVLLIYLSGNLDYSGGLMGAYTIKVAVNKAALSPLQCISSGILCNTLVCLAILIAGAAKDAAGKILGIFFPIFAFIAGGFEHIVANMYYIPAGMMAMLDPVYVEKAKETFSLSDAQLSLLSFPGILPSFLFVTIGNVLGGMGFVGVLHSILYRKKDR